MSEYEAAESQLEPELHGSLPSLSYTDRHRKLIFFHYFFFFFFTQNQRCNVVNEGLKARVSLQWISCSVLICQKAGIDLETMF